MTNVSPAIARARAWRHGVGMPIPPVDAPDPGDRSSQRDVEAFLAGARALATERGAAARLIFALDATMSRQPTWDLSARLQAGMFAAVADLGGLSVQLAYYRGRRECRASRWVTDAGTLTSLMHGIACQGGRTQIRRILSHAALEAARGPLQALVFVGDAMEEPIDDVCDAAGQLALAGVTAFMFHEGHDPATVAAFGEVARITGGAALGFDTASAGALASLLRAAAAYAAGGHSALRRLAAAETGARRLLAGMARP